MEAQPDVRKLSNPSIGAPSQIDDVGDSEGTKFLDVGLFCYRAAKRQPPSNPKHLHALPALCASPKWPSCLINCCFTNAICARFAPVNLSTCSLAAGRVF